MKTVKFSIFSSALYFIQYVFFLCCFNAVRLFTLPRLILLFTQVVVACVCVHLWIVRCVRICMRNLGLCLIVCVCAYVRSAFVHLYIRQTETIAMFALTGANFASFSHSFACNLLIATFQSFSNFIHFHFNIHGNITFFLVYSRQCLRWIVYVCQPMLSTCACLRAYSTYVCIVVIFLQATHTPDIRRSMKKQDGCLTKFIWRFAVQYVRLALNLKKNHFYKNVAAHFNRMKL